MAKDFESQVRMKNAPTNSLHLVRKQELQGITPATIYTVATNTVGHRIKTDIPSNQAGLINVHFKADTGVNTAYCMYDTDVVCRVNTNGTISNNYFHQNNKGRAAQQAIAYVDTDSTWTFFIGHNTQYLKVEATVTFYPSAAYSTAVSYSNDELYNRVVGISAQTAIPATTLTGYNIVPEANMVSSLSSLDMNQTIYIATENGDNTAFSPATPTRAGSFKTFARALNKLPKNSVVTIQINKYVTPLYRSGTTSISAYASTTAYTVGQRCTYNGYAYECVEAVTGTTPTIGMTTPWRHVNLATTSHGTYDPDATYAVGNTVVYNDLTYLSLKASNLGNTPALSTDATSYWVVCGEYNPVVTESTPQLTGFGGVTITNGDGNLKIIFTSGLTISQSKWVITSVLLCVAGTLGISYNTAAVISASIDANAISCSYNSYVRFSSTVNAFATVANTYNDSVAFATLKAGTTISISNCGFASLAAVTAGTYFSITTTGSVVASGVVSAGSYVQINSTGYCNFLSTLTAQYLTVGGSGIVICTGNVVFAPTAVSTAAIAVTAGARLTLCANATLTGFAGANAASGISVSNSYVKIYGTISINGFREGILSTAGGDVDNFGIITISKPATNTTAACYAIQVNTRARFIQNKGATITRNNSLADNINATGTFIDYSLNVWETLTFTPAANYTSTGIVVKLNRSTSEIVFAFTNFALRANRAIGEVAGTVALPAGFTNPTGTVYTVVGTDVGTTGRQPVMLGFNRSNGEVSCYDMIANQYTGTVAAAAGVYGQYRFLINL